MTGPSGSPQNHVDKPPPSFREQLLVTFAILLATGTVFGGIWLLDTFAH